MAASKPTIPFAWLGRYAFALRLIILLAIGTVFRFYQLNSLPPGLSGSTARIGLQALDLIKHGWLPTMSIDNSCAPLWVYFQALPIKLLGPTTLALHLWPATLGTLAVLTTWLWARDWFTVRIGSLAALLLAVTPWAVTASRDNIVVAGIPLLATLTLWLIGVDRTTPGTWRYPALAAVIAIDLTAGPLGWLIAATALAITAWELARRRRHPAPSPALAAGAVILAAGLAGFVYLAANSLSQLKQLPSVIQFTGAGHLASGLVQTLLMIVTRASDENYLHNLAGEPLLNAFIGLMFLAGLVFAVSKLHEHRYQLLLILFFVFLTPAIISTRGIPNAALAITALPIIMALAAIGISFMLDLWYSTFPINAAARTVGQAMITILLLLTVFQGFTQYFYAWADSSATYIAYNEAATRIAADFAADHSAATRFAIAPSASQPAIQYLTDGQPLAAVLQPSQILSLPTQPGSRRFLIDVASRNDALHNLKLKFPGGILRPVYSNFDQTELYDTYEITTK